MSDDNPERRFRTLFISDVHLGARGSQADRLLDFLRVHDADTIYLVGDIVDGWALKSSWHWPQSHNDLLQKMLRKARKGARIIYVPGNHDEFLRSYYGTHFGGIEVAEDAIHIGVDGRRYLVIHGDIFDLVVQNARWLAHLGDKAYDFAIQMNRLVNAFRKMFGVPYWSLSQWAKLKVKNAVNYIGAFEQTLANEARRHDADGVICGHIHYATIRDEHGIRYMNCGDWVESCTALVEHQDGHFEIITWSDPIRRSTPVAVAAAVKSRVMRILIATDAWQPQVNGVVRTLMMTAAAAQAHGVEVSFLTPQSFRTVAMPGYRDLRLALPSPFKIARLIADAKPDNIHIATEGPLGLAVRHYCRRRGLPFTTSFHTRFPDYVTARLPIPESWVWTALRWFHRDSRAVMAATPALATELRKRGFNNVVLWPRGVDTKLFHPRDLASGWPGPVFLSVGRLAVEKNLEAFLSLDLPGTKVVVGDGPARAALERSYPQAVFLGALHGEQLAQAYAVADVFVFPSLTDTFGLVMLEALASGVPVAAFPVAGPRDVIGSSPVGVLNNDLRLACLAALNIAPQDCIAFAERHSWDSAARIFIANIAGGVPTTGGTPAMGALAPL